MNKLHPQSQPLPQLQTPSFTTQTPENPTLKRALDSPSESQPLKDRDTKTTPPRLDIDLFSQIIEKDELEWIHHETPSFSIDDEEDGDVKDEEDVEKRSKGKRKEGMGEEQDSNPPPSPL